MTQEPQQLKPPVHKFHTYIHPTADNKTGTGITYGGTRQHMEIGKTCQNFVASIVENLVTCVENVPVRRRLTFMPWQLDLRKSSQS